jgi:hypothetical protein
VSVSRGLSSNGASMISECRFKILDCGILYVALFNLLESEIALAPVLPSTFFERDF